jgi:bacterial/archaeal transporter family protein
MEGIALPWQFWAVLSAVFAALTAIFAKIGIESVNSDFATFIRTIVILGCLAAFLFATDQFQSPGAISRRTYAFLEQILIRRDHNQLRRRSSDTLGR